MTKLRGGLLAFVCAGAMLAGVARGQEPEMLTEDGVIAGTMEIDFKTRTTPDTSGELVEGSPAKGAQDKYSFSLVVAKTTQFAGEIVRLPNLYSKTLRRLQQSAMINYHVDLAVMNPKNPSEKKTVGKWTGSMPINTEVGAYELAGGRKDERPLRIAVDAIGSGKGFTDYFGGRLLGKAEKKDNLAGYSYKRLIGKKTVEITIKKSDPMRFEGLELAKGPAESYPHTTVNGRLDYDYETGNWFTDGIRFKYSLAGKDYEDVISGSIRWVEDPARSSNGKGQYEFNLRFNEDKHKSAADESAAFAAMSAEDAFFAVDNTIPCMTGTIAYVDTMIAGQEIPSSSKVTFNLNANKLTKQQIMNFFKLWMIAVGPTNDE